MAREYYECGICGCIHRWNFDGDCRDDSERLDMDDLPVYAVIHTWETRLRVDREEMESRKARLSFA